MFNQTAEDCIQDLLGVSLSIFKEQFFEKNFLITKIPTYESWCEACSIEAVDDIITKTHLRTAMCKFFANGDSVPPDAYSRTWRYDGDPIEDVLDADKLAKLYRKLGGTIALYDVGRRIEAVNRKCLSIGRALNCKANASFYMTSPNTSHGVGPHFDVVDVIIVQIAGKKNWEFWGCENGLPQREAFSERFSVGLQKAESSESSKVAISKGEAAYIPRGLVHRASTGEEPSLHVAIGLDFIRYSEAVGGILDAAMIDAAHRSPELRRSVQIKRSESGGVQLDETQRGLIQAEIDRVLGELTLDSVHAFTKRDRMRKTAAPSFGRISQISPNKSVHSDTVFVRKSDLLVRLAELSSSQRVMIEWGDRSVSFPIDAIHLLKYIVLNPTFYAKDVPMSERNVQNDYLLELERLGFIERASHITE